MHLHGSWRSIVVVGAFTMAVLAGCNSSGGSDTSGLPAGAQPSADMNLAMIVPDDGVDPVVRLIDNAQTSVAIGTYDIDPEYDDVIDALLRAQARGVDVRVMDSATTFPLDKPQLNAQDVAALQAKGINAQLSNPEFSYYHAKFVLVDAGTPSAQALVSDFNFAASYFGPDPNNPTEGGTRGMAVLATNPDDVAEIAAYYEADWPPFSQWPASDRPNVIWSPSEDTFTNPGTSDEAMKSFITGAKDTLDIYAQQFPVNSELLAPIEAAAKKGVKVRIVANKVGFDKAVADALQPLGVEIQLDPSAPTNDGRTMYVHTKTMVADGNTDRAVAYVGSINPFLQESLNTERELGVLVTDQPSIRRMLDTFNRDFASGTAQP